jgi:DNA adenine methylase
MVGTMTDLAQKSRKRQPSRRAKSRAVQAVLDRPGMPSRPALRYHGGKWRLAPFILDHFPPHRIYVEPFCGAASILLRKEPAYAEVINDRDSEVTNFFRVCRDPDLSGRLVREIELTPFARDEFKEAYEVSDDPVERARRLVILSYMGFGSNAHCKRTTGFRSNSNRSVTTPAHDWRAWPKALVEIIERLRGVVIENRDAREVMRSHDSPATLHYVDPPYVWDTRSQRSPSDAKYRRYNYEMSDEDHEALVRFLRDEICGMVVLSGYPSPIYDNALRDWLRVTTHAHADGAKDRTEVLWINPAAAGRIDPAVLSPAQLAMFESSAT